MKSNERSAQAPEAVVFDKLTAPFQVILEHLPLDTEDVPDHFGLSGAVLYSRVLHPRPLKSKEIQFLRKVLTLKQGEVAAALGIKQESLSRIENDVTSMGLSTEKLFRIFLLKIANELYGVEKAIGRAVINECLSLIFSDMRSPPRTAHNNDLALRFTWRDGLWRRVVDERYRH